MISYLIILASIVGLYCAIVFFLSRLVIPFMGFQQYLPPRDLPKEIEDTIESLEQKSHDQQSYLKAVHAFVRGRWKTERMKTLVKFPLILRTDIGDIWQSQGYAHSNTINFVMYTLLANSRYFSEHDVRTKHTFLNGVIHQYLQIRINGEWIDVDPPSSYANVPIGKHARGFR